MYAVDWAIKKTLRIYDIRKDKLKELKPTIEDFGKFLSKLKNKGPFYFEEGGGETFKLMAYRAGHPVYTVPGIKVKNLREELGLNKSDEVDAVTLGLLAKNQPGIFYQFEEKEVLDAQIKLAFRVRYATKKNKIREKDRLFALRQKVELMNLDGYEKELIIKQEGVVKALEEKFKNDTKVLDKLVRKHKYWEFFKDIKGVGPAIAGGLIGEINLRNTPGKYNLCSYAGMKKKKGDQNFNHYLKDALITAAKEFHSHKTPGWKNMYDSMKKFYKEKHPDWNEEKVKAYTKKFVATKFLIEFYKFAKG